MGDTNNCYFVIKLLYSRLTPSQLHSFVQDPVGYATIQQTEVPYSTVVWRLDNGTNNWMTVYNESALESSLLFQCQELHNTFLLSWSLATFSNHLLFTGSLLVYYTLVNTSLSGSVLYSYTLHLSWGEDWRK